MVVVLLRVRFMLLVLLWSEEMMVERGVLLGCLFWGILVWCSVLLFGIVGVLR